MRLLAVLLALFCLAACADQPAATYDGEVARLTKLGRLDVDAQSVAHVQSIVDRLAVVYAKAFPSIGAWDAHVIRNDRADAWALPGGHIIVTEQLLRIGLTDDELAMALSHEMAHVVLGHSDAALRAYRTQLMNTQLQYQLQNYEMQADKLGMLAAERAGYPRAAMATMLRKMEANTTRTHEANSDHPSWTRRIEQAEAVR